MRIDAACLNALPATSLIIPSSGIQPNRRGSYPALRALPAVVWRDVRARRIRMVVRSNHRNIQLLNRAKASRSSALPCAYPPPHRSAPRHRLPSPVNAPPLPQRFPADNRCCSTRIISPISNICHPSAQRGPASCFACMFSIMRVAGSLILAVIAPLHSARSNRTSYMLPDRLFHRKQTSVPAALSPIP